MSDKEKATNIVELLAKHWWYHMAVVKHVKGDNDEKVKENIAQGLNKPNGDILHVYTTDTKGEELLMKHSPDVVLLVEHEAKELHLVVCGTKVHIESFEMHILRALNTKSSNKVTDH